MYEPLVIQDYKTIDITDSGLVTAIDLVDDTHISLTLREGVKFQSGKELQQTMYCISSSRVSAAYMQVTIILYGM